MECLNIIIFVFQDNRYDNQRHVLLQNTARDSDGVSLKCELLQSRVYYCCTSVFPIALQTDQGIITPVNGVILNGDLGSNTSTPDIPGIEISPSNTPPIQGEDCTTATTPAAGREDSLTPPGLRSRSAVTPGRRAMEALNKVSLQ